VILKRRLRVRKPRPHLAGKVIYLLRQHDEQDCQIIGGFAALIDTGFVHGLPTGRDDDVSIVVRT
jgi:hypothetical protein